MCGANSPANVMISSLPTLIALSAPSRLWRRGVRDALAPDDSALLVGQAQMRRDVDDAVQRLDDTYDEMRNEMSAARRDIARLHAIDYARETEGGETRWLH
jgi:hypothetical protein